MPLSSFRAEKHWKSEHWRPATSMIWMYSPALDDIGLRRRAVDADVLQRIGERVGEDEAVLHGTRVGAMDAQLDRRGSVLRLWLHRAAGRRDDQDAIALDAKFLRGAGR